MNDGKQRYLHLFLDESRALLRQAAAALAKAQGTPPASLQSTSTGLHRMWHSLKGMSAALAIEELVELAHKAEDHLPQLSAPQDAGEALALQAVAIDAAERYLHALETTQAPPDLHRVRRSLQTASAAGRAPEPVMPAQQASDASPGPLPHPASSVLLPSTVRIRAGELDHILGDLVELESAMGTVGDEANTPPSPLQRRLRFLRQRVQHLRLLPFDTLVPAFTQLVARDAGQMGRQVGLRVSGGHHHLERGTLELLAEVLPHLLRNAIAHGIASPSARRRQGLPERGMLAVTLEPRRSSVEVRVEDDGAGPSLDAWCRRFPDGVADRQAMSRPAFDWAPLLCRPGLSTSPAATRIAGRGMGLHAVRERLLAAGGALQIHRRDSGGLTVLTRVPATLSVRRCLVVRIGALHYALPLPGLDNLEAEPATPVSPALGRLLAPSCSPDANPSRLFITLRSLSGTPVSLPVDEILGRMETVVRPLPGLRAGSALLGTALWQHHVPVLVLDPVRLAEVQASPDPPADALSSEPGRSTTPGGPTGACPATG